MHCPRLSDLPIPPAGKTGWPWTEEGSLPADTMPSGAPWPRLSIITPSYNQGEFIEETVRSVLLQGYPDLEYIVIDGGSTDNSVGVIRKYERWLAFWVSEPDRGQSQAINKGFRRATGRVLAWLNSDDTYLPGTLAEATRMMADGEAPIVYSRCRLVTPTGEFLKMYDPLPHLTLRSLILLWEHDFACPPQPTVFFRREILERVGLLDESLHYGLDYELWLRAIQYFGFSFVDAVWATYRVHPESKTGKGWLPFVNEICAAGKRHCGGLGLRDRLVYLLAGKRRMIGRRYLDQAFDASFGGYWRDVRRWLLKAISVDPSRLFNRGVLSLCRQAWGRHLRNGGYRIA